MERCKLLPFRYGRYARSDGATVVPALAVQRQQQQAAERLLQRLEEVQVHDLTLHYCAEHSHVVLPGVLKT